MRRSFLIPSLVCAILSAQSAEPRAYAAAPQDALRPANSLLEDVQAPQLGTFKVCLRLEDQTPFLGAATIRALPESGDEPLGLRDDAKGEMFFYGVVPGRYVIVVNAPAFVPVRLPAQMETGGRLKAFFVVMKALSAAKSADDLLITSPPADAATAEVRNENAELQVQTVTEIKTVPEGTLELRAPAEAKPSAPWKPVEWDDSGLSADASVACPVEQVLRNTRERVREFISSMEKFTALETVEHFSVDKNGDRHQPESRKFAYVVTVAQDRRGTFTLEEFRDGGIDNSRFPSNIATMGLPAVVLVFHPNYSDDFTFNCDGLIRKDGHDYWQMRFAQREDRPVRIESYVVNGNSFPVYLQGRAWIDTGKSQVVRLESQLLKPTPQIELWQQHQIIDYTGVKFASTGQEVWLPQAAEVYVERHNRRYLRRHTFRDFRLFNVDTAQSMKAPKGSYSFTNLTDRDMAGELTVNPIDELKGGPVILRFEVPAHRTVIKTVGPGKDVNLPAAAIASAKFVHTGDGGAVRVDVDLLKETTLDIVPERALANP